MYTSQSDVWSFGVLLFEIISLGATPYGTLATGNLASMLEDGYRMEKPRGTPDDYYGIMTMCWQYYANDRPVRCWVFFLFRLLLSAFVV